jgi:hypothetical protein
LQKFKNNFFCCAHYSDGKKKLRQKGEQEVKAPVFRTGVVV